MIDQISTEFESLNNVRFVLDDDPYFRHLVNSDFSSFDRFFVFIDKNVKKIWGDLVFNTLKTHGKEIFIHELEAVEETKSLRYYPEALKFLEENTAGRYDLVFGIGGGIVIDLTSFLVSTYMRGLPLYLIPTTLIGQTDASTAGKTCLNSYNSKNLLGTFYYPFEVYNNINFLKTCSAYHHRQGLSEAFKYTLLSDGEAIGFLTNKNGDNADIDLIKKTIESRISIRKKHALASNLGHTFGHALEKISDFNILHGDAISAGTVMSLYFSVEKGLMKDAEKNKIIKLMKDSGLNIFVDKNLDIDLFIKLMLRDKKSSSSKLNLVLIKKIGEPYCENRQYFYEASPSEMIDFMNRFMKDYDYCIDNCYKYIKQDKLFYDL